MQFGVGHPRRFGRLSAGDSGCLVGVALAGPGWRIAAIARERGAVTAARVRIVRGGCLGSSRQPPFKLAPRNYRITETHPYSIEQRFDQSKCAGSVRACPGVTGG